MGWNPKHWPWKKIGQGALKGIALAGVINPAMAPIAATVEAIQHAMPTATGADKKTAVENVTDAILDSSLTGFSDAKVAAIKSARSDVIDAIVAFKHAEADLEHAKLTLEEAWHEEAPPVEPPVDLSNPPPAASTL